MDPVADALIRIKNGYMARKVLVLVSYSNLVIKLCELLVKQGFIEKVEKQNERDIKVTLKYQNRKPALTDIKRISKPGRRVYKGVKELPWVLNGLGVALISTPKGLMTEKEARKEGVGGEVMAYVW